MSTILWLVDRALDVVVVFETTVLTRSVEMQLADIESRSPLLTDKSVSP